MTGITPSPDNFRAEMARHRLTRTIVAELLGMHVNQLSMYVTELVPLPFWARHNIAYAINRATGLRIFEVEMGRGLMLKEHASTGSTRKPRDPRNTVVLPATKRRKSTRRRRGEGQPTPKAGPPQI